MSQQDLAAPGANTHSRLTQKGVARREQILDTAKRLFLEHGYADVSVDDLVRAAGGSKTNVYSHFGGKNGLFMAAVESLCGDFLREFREVQLQGLKAEVGLLRLAHSLLDTLLQDRHIAFQRLVIAESARFPELAVTWYRAGPSASRAVMADFIRHRQKDGELREVDAMAAAVLLHDMVVSEPVYLATMGQPMPAAALQAHVKQAVGVFLAGVLAA